MCVCDLGFDVCILGHFPRFFTIWGSGRADSTARLTDCNHSPQFAASSNLCRYNELITSRTYHTLVRNFAAELEVQGLWQCAVFVLLHMPGFVPAVYDQASGEEMLPESDDLDMYVLRVLSVHVVFTGGLLRPCLSSASAFARNMSGRCLINSVYWTPTRLRIVSASKGELPFIPRKYLYGEVS